MNTAEHLCSAVSSALCSVTLIEGFDPTLCSSLPLLAGVERMAFRADINPQFFFYRTCQEVVPTGTRNLDFVILRMNLFFHIACTSLFMDAVYSFSSCVGYYNTGSPPVQHSCRGKMDTCENGAAGKTAPFSAIFANRVKPAAAAYLS